MEGLQWRKAAPLPADRRTFASSDINQHHVDLIAIECTKSTGLHWLYLC